MSPWLGGSGNLDAVISVTYRIESAGPNEDRLLIKRRGERTIAIVCDGAGNGGKGALAADFAINELEQVTAQEGFIDWVPTLLGIDQLLKVSLTAVMEPGMIGLMAPVFGGENGHPGGVKNGRILTRWQL